MFPLGGRGIRAGGRKTGLDEVEWEMLRPLGLARAIPAPLCPGRAHIRSLGGGDWCAGLTCHRRSGQSLKVPT